MSEKRKRKTSIPNSLQPILWSADIGKLDIKKDKAYVIHQIFAYGTMKEIIWLFHTYAKKELITVFISCPYKDYFAARFYFVKNYILNLRDFVMNERRYVKNTPRDIR